MVLGGVGGGSAGGARGAILHRCRSAAVGVGRGAGLYFGGELARGVERGKGDNTKYHKQCTSFIESLTLF